MDILLNAVAGFKESDSDRFLEVRATSGGIRSASGSTAAKAAESSDTAAEYAFEDIAHISETAAEAVHTASAAAIAWVNACVTELVVSCTFFRVGENLISLVDFLEFLNERGVVGVEVRVILSCFFSVSFFYLVLRSTLLDTQDFVLITFFCHIYSPINE